jgi:4-hydroxy-tetrahydrodipicolinate synthase
MSGDQTWTALPQGIGRIVTAMVTPFTDDGDVDVDGAATLAQHLVATGTETVLVNGTTGESPTLTGNESWAVLAAVRDAVGDDATVMMGTGTNATRSTVAATERATIAGADAIMVVTPYYNRPSQRGLAEHFRAAAAATDLPVVLYDIPFRTGREIATETLIDLASVPNIAGVKDATTDLGKIADVLAGTHGAEGGFGVWCGADEVNLAVLATGGHGVVSVSAHLAGPEIAEMVRVFPTDPARARELHLRCMALHRALFAEPSPAPLKAVLVAEGLPAGPVRAPMTPASPETVQVARDAYAQLVSAR